jgi:hypothetical protein
VAGEILKMRGVITTGPGAIYREDLHARRNQYAVNYLSWDEARRIAKAIARLPKLLKRSQGRHLAMAALYVSNRDLCCRRGAPSATPSPVMCYHGIRYTAPPVHSCRRDAQPSLHACCPLLRMHSRACSVLLSGLVEAPPAAAVKTTTGEIILIFTPWLKERQTTDSRCTHKMRHREDPG